MTGIRATYNPDKRTLKYSWPDGTYSIFDDYTEDEARKKTGLSSIPLVIAVSYLLEMGTDDGLAMIGPPVADDERMTTPFATKQCVVCGQHAVIELDPAKLQRWKAGELVQYVWPERSADWREMLVSGTHPKCWAELT